MAIAYLQSTSTGEIELPWWGNTDGGGSDRNLFTPLSISNIRAKNSL